MTPNFEGETQGTKVDYHQRRWKVLVIGGEGGGGTDDSVCTREGGRGHAPPKKKQKIGALRSLLRPFLYSNLYLDLMPLAGTLGQ